MVAKPTEVKLPPGTEGATYFQEGLWCVKLPPKSRVVSAGSITQLMGTQPWPKYSKYSHFTMIKHTNHCDTELTLTLSVLPLYNSKDKQLTNCSKS